jgi:hypothetical protein
MAPYKVSAPMNEFWHDTRPKSTYAYSSCYNAYMGITELTNDSRMTAISRADRRAVQTWPDGGVW